MLPRKVYFDSIFDHFMDEKMMDDMKCDIFEKENIYHIVLDVPGVSKEDIKVECNEGYLMVAVEKKEEEDTSNQTFIRKERTYGKMSRKFYVGSVKEEEIKATFKDGILMITIPKTNRENNRKIIHIQ